MFRIASEAVCWICSKINQPVKLYFYSNYQTKQDAIQSASQVIVKSRENMCLETNTHQL